jgi:hypothetical protein
VIAVPPESASPTHDGLLAGETVPRAKFVVADGTLETLKWGAAAFMVVDHTNKFLYAEHLPTVFQIGRIVMPIFAFVLAYNLARPGARESGARGRMIYRLAFWGVVATPMSVVLNGTLVGAYAWWPFNILFTLLLIVVLVDLIEKGGAARRAAAVALFLVGGALVEFLWFGVACGLAAWAFCRKPTELRLGIWILATLSLSVVNQNAWAIAAIPLILGASKLTLRTPRIKWAFYALYPFHLLVFMIVRREWF